MTTRDALLRGLTAWVSPRKSATNATEATDATGAGRAGSAAEALLVRLTAETEVDVPRLGGKAAGLVRLLRAGLPVPEAWCVPATTAPDDPRLGPALVALWKHFAAEAPPEGARLAVRSSATVEDLAGASSAGLYRSVLGVASAAALVEAVGLCHSSLDAPEAVAYRGARLGQERARMAVVIQRLVAAEVAGVLLTENPARSFGDELVVEAVHGLGEGLVSGAVDPDHFVLARDTGALREQRLGAKQAAVRLAPGGGTRVEGVAAAARLAPALGPSQLRALFELAARLTERLGPRQDCEFAFMGEELFVLQARPMTGLPPRRPERVFSRKFGDEYLADCSTPLGATLLARWISDLVFHEVAVLTGQRELALLEPVRQVRGYSYVSGEYLAVMTRGLPPRARAAALQGWFTPLGVAAIARRGWSPLALARRALVRPADPRAPWRANLAALERHARHVETSIASRLGEALGRLTEGELAVELERALDLGVEHFRIIRWGMGQHNPVLHALLRGLLARWAGDADGQLYADLVGGLSGTRTTALNRDLWRLGLAARADGRIAAALDAGDAGVSRRSSTADSAFWPAFDAFLTAHGHRAESREISTPRWRERPELVLALVRAQLAGAEPPRDPAELEARALARRLDAERRAESGARRGLGGALRGQVLSRVVSATQAFTRYRENQRATLDLVLCRIRELVLEQGRRLAEAGVLSTVDDVFFLEARELREQLAVPAPSTALTERLRERRAEHEASRRRLPATYLFDEVETEGELVEGAASGSARDERGAAVVGLGASRGTAEGRLRVLTSLTALAELRRGEILVAPNIDPAWTSVFPLLGGVITETGGLLSHGALLAREYGVPAVMGVPDATARFTTGTLARLDGARGTIEILDAPALAD